MFYHTPFQVKAENPRIYNKISEEIVENEQGETK